MQQYSRLSSDNPGIQLGDVAPHPRPSLSDSDDSDDVIVYRDNLEDEPFAEKDRRFNDEGRMEDGEGYSVESRRVSRGYPTESISSIRLTAAAAG